MKARNAVVLVLALASILIAAQYYADDPVSESAELVISFEPDNIGVVSLGRQIYDQNCASCHGLDLEGELSWRQRKKNGRFPAPPHDAFGHTWHHTENVLFNITKYGPAALIGDPTYQSDMPAYNDILSDTEIVAALSYIKSRWPDNIRKKHDAITAANEKQNQ